MPEMSKSFSELLVSDVEDLVIKQPAAVQAGTKLYDAYDLYVRHPDAQQIYVVDPEGKLVGAITIENLLRLLGYRVGIREFTGLSLWKMLRDIMKENVDQVVRRVPHVKPTDKLIHALQIMLDNHLTDLPIIDPEDRLIGELNSMELFTRGKDLFQQ